MSSLTSKEEADLAVLLRYVQRFAATRFHDPALADEMSAQVIFALGEYVSVHKLPHHPRQWVHAVFRNLSYRHLRSPRSNLMYCGDLANLDASHDFFRDEELLVQGRNLLRSNEHRILNLLSPTESNVFKQVLERKSRYRIAKSCGLYPADVDRIIVRIGRRIRRKILQSALPLHT